MSAETEVKAAESGFFEALLLGSRERLEKLLAIDFTLIDVVTGSEITRNTFVDLVGTKHLVFDSIARLEARVRLYDGAAVATGATRMRGHYGGQSFQSHSRYTHVYVRNSDRWHLVAAQGTPIAAATD